MNTCGSSQYIEVLQSKMFGLCKKLNVIYNIIYNYFNICDPGPQDQS